MGCLIWMGFSAIAQQKDAGKSVAQVEEELAKIAFDILNHDSTDHKFEINKEFIVRMTDLLKRPESFGHPFESMKTVSRQTPEDNSFRIFTWYIVDRTPEAYYAENAHYYFGLIQRRHVDPSGKVHHIVIPLMEMDQIPRGFENIVTDNFDWFGALYYKPKHEKHLLAYDGHYYKLVPKKGEVKESTEKEQTVTFIKGRYKSRILSETSKLSYDNHKRVKESVRYYVLTGWNGWDNKANYKVFELLSFDPEDSTRAIFGAPIIYFGKIPKARALFKYSDVSHFSLNTGYVKRGPFNLGKRQMLIYDHMAVPENTRPSEKYELGPDGTYDALSYYPRYGGYFEWYRKVETADNYESRQHRKEMAEKQLYYAAQDSLTFPDYAKLSSKKEQRRINKSNKRVLKQQKEAAEARMKATGFDPKGKKE